MNAHTRPDLVEQLTRMVLDLAARVRAIEAAAPPKLPPSPAAPQRRTLPTARPIVRMLVQDAALRFGVSGAAIVGPDRHAPTVEARQWVMFEAYQVGCSYPRIGRELGHRDHTTIMHGVRREAERRAVQG